MASKINADEFVNREGEDKPTLPKGVVLSGVTTITTAVVAGNEVANSTGINAGIITSTHFKGNLTGDVNAGIVTVSSQTVVGSAVTISASGIDIGAGVITATSYAGSGANLTGLGATIMVWEYNPDPYDTAVTFASGIGITFNQQIKAGTGNITLREDSASGTVVENFGIGSSVTISNNELSLTPTSNLSETKIYHLSYPSGVITNMAGESYVGTAYTFQSKAVPRELWSWGYNRFGGTGQNNTTRYSSPVQIPGTKWKRIVTGDRGSTLATKNDGTLWSWGYGYIGNLGHNEGGQKSYSSPVQVGSDNTWNDVTEGYYISHATKTDGTLWCWGANYYGQLAEHNATSKSSPCQIGSDTDWSTVSGEFYSTGAIKTDGTLWVWGRNTIGQLGQNSVQSTPSNHGTSSPVQIPGTWSQFGGGSSNYMGLKTDGTLWSWGDNEFGELGHNVGLFNPSTAASISSPTQIPGTTWAVSSKAYRSSAAIKTDGTLWMWGHNGAGFLGQNNLTNRSSPVQVPGTTWGYIAFVKNGWLATKTDGTLWSWGDNENGQLGHNNHTQYSSPTQVPGTEWIKTSGYWGNTKYAVAATVNVMKETS
tara:strand:+ start:1418 stop:3199 length:1782 start_codon:yes stop_codon:yes gene_type:complete